MHIGTEARARSRARGKAKAKAGLGPLAKEVIARSATVGRVEALCTRLRRRQLIGSYPTSMETIKLLQEVVAGARFATFEALCDVLEEVGEELQRAGPKEIVIGNTVRRVLKFLREEYANALGRHLVEQEHETGSSSETLSSEAPHHSSHQALGSLPPDSSVRPPDSLANPSFPPAPQRPEGPGASSIFDLLGHPRANQHGLGGRLSGGGETALGSETPLVWSPPESRASRAPTPDPASPAVSAATGPPGSSLGIGLGAGQSKKARAEAERGFSAKAHTLKPLFIDAIQELCDEVEASREEVAALAVDHVHSSEIIMTMGHSKTVEAFLKAAARKRKFTVIAAETAPTFSGRALAKSLSTPTASGAGSSGAGISTLLIPDSSTFALMPRCSKVVIGCHAVLADGSLFAEAGSLNLAMAAQAHLVPVVVVCGMYKFSPEYKVGESELANADLKNPEQVLKVDEVLAGDGAGGRTGEAVEIDVLNPYYDRVPADLVSLFITNLGTHPPSLIFRSLTDLYGTA